MVGRRGPSLSKRKGLREVKGKRKIALSAGLYDEYGRYDGGYGPGSRFPDATDYPGRQTCGQNTTVVGAGSIVYIDLEKAKDLIAPRVKFFQEDGREGLENYRWLLEKICQDMGVPAFKKNRPTLELSDADKTSGRALQGKYEPSTRKIQMPRLRLNFFLACVYLYIKDRNGGFKGTFGTSVFKGNYPENTWADEVLKKAQPEKIERLKQRTFLVYEEIE